MHTPPDALITLRPARPLGGDQALPASLSASETFTVGRLLRLSGTWTRPGESSFSLEAVLAVMATRVDGPVLWARNGPRRLSGVEIVRGRLAVMTLALRGVSAERGLACDQYRITLSGDDRRGTFAGTSWAFGSWDGRLGGVYRFQDGTSPGG